MNNEENRNLLLAIALSALVVIGWAYFVPGPQKPAPKPGQAQSQVLPGVAPAGYGVAPHVPSAKEALAAGGPRIAIDNGDVDGSIRLTGASFDDLHLKHYRETVDPKSAEIDLLSPDASAHPYYAVFGWLAAPGSTTATPGAGTHWTLAGGAKLTPQSPVTLTWDNGQGLLFTRTISIDNQYMFTLRDTVVNRSGAPVTLYPYAYVARENVAQVASNWLLHEGFAGVGDGALKDATYADYKEDKPPLTFSSTGGWLGIADKYWMATVVPPQNASFDGTYRSVATATGGRRYQADYRLGGRTIAPGGSTSIDQRLFAGAKVVQVLDHYKSTLGIAGFDLAIDWGWFRFIIQPIFWLLDTYNHWLGNFGLAILLLTITIKALFFPLADASFKSMSKMKKLQPEMEKLKTRFADDREGMNKAMMELYQREKVNPVSGCLPMLIQMPVFFSLYKVLYVTIEMRHAPFYGWIHDLSAPDPTSILNLFGLLPYHIPAFVPVFLSIGIWPILMGFTQFLSTKMNPAPTDPVQAQMFTYMPLLFTFMMAGFPAGLVIYWTWNNLLTALQQYIVMRRQGVDVHLVENLKLRQAGAAVRSFVGGRRAIDE